MDEDTALLECLNLIANGPMFRPLIKYLKDRREETRDRLENQPGDRFHVDQGRALELKELLEQIERAPKSLEKRTRK
jgi:hypothetical protein